VTADGARGGAGDEDGAVAGFLECDGDEELYAVRHALIRKGWRADALLPTEAVLPSGEHHLVLIARTGEGDFVLDNLKDRVRTVADASMDYKWVRMVSPRDPKYWNKVEQPS